MVNYYGGPLRGRGVAGWILRRRAARHGDLPSERRAAVPAGPGHRPVPRHLDATGILLDMVASVGNATGPQIPT
jgi:hypothetical protein